MGFINAAFAYEIDRNLMVERLAEMENLSASVNYLIDTGTSTYYFKFLNEKTESERKKIVFK